MNIERYRWMHLIRYEVRIFHWCVCAWYLGLLVLGAWGGNTDVSFQKDLTDNKSLSLSLQVCLWMFDFYWIDQSHRVNLFYGLKRYLCFSFKMYYNSINIPLYLLLGRKFLAQLSAEILVHNLVTNHAHDWGLSCSCKTISTSTFRIRWSDYALCVVN